MQEIGSACSLKLGECETPVSKQVFAIGIAFSSDLHWLTLIDITGRTLMTRCKLFVNCRYGRA